jgi:hypothetical protein
MELFPATDIEQFEYIKSVIRDSDYYVIVSAGRYGSIHPERQLSYTELEYDYAVEVGVPIIRLLHSDPFNDLRGEQIESTDQGREKLRAFRDKMQASRLVRHWASKEQLGAEIVFALLDMQKSHPRDGWVPGSQSFDPETFKELDRLRKENAQLLRNSSSKEDVPLERFLEQFSGEINCRIFEKRNGERLTAPMKSIELPRVVFTKSDFVQIFLYALLDGPLQRNLERYVELEVLRHLNLPSSKAEANEPERVYYQCKIEPGCVSAAMDVCMHQSIVHFSAPAADLVGHPERFVQLTPKGERMVRGHRAAHFLNSAD